MRAFVAVDLPTIVVDGIPSGSDAQPSHVTLEFLGDVPEARAGEIAAALADAAADVPPFDVAVSGVGAFPSTVNPRVVYVGVSVGGASLVALARAVGEALRPLGFAPELRPFVPHVTLLRVRSPSHLRRALTLLTHPPDVPPAVGRVTEVLLKASRLDPSGAVHHVIARFPLGTPRGASGGEPSVVQRRHR